ncbi:MAG: hypothetical protein ACK4UN_00160 [Limisphaerales bacterium]
MNINEIIDRAFGKNVYPGDDNLTVYDRGGRNYDDTWKLLRGVDWREMPVYEFITGDTPIPDLTPEAFHYYLPALLKASLVDDLADYVWDSMKFYLNPKNARSDHPEFGYDNTEDFERFRSLLSNEERSAILAVMEEWKALGVLNEVEYQELRQAYQF